MRHLCVMLKPASGLCNMRCAYCFYTDITRMRETPSYGMMPLQTAYRIVDSLLADLRPSDQLTLAFQGGEPSLAGLAFYSQLFAYIEGRRGGVAIEYAFQTNGLELDEAWCALFKQSDVLVGLSLDGKELHDLYRRDALGEGTYKRVLGTKQLLDRFGVRYNILSVLSRQMAQHPTRVWRFLEREDISFVQFIPCLDSLACNTASAYALTPRLFHSFYVALFSLWQDNLARGRYRSIKLFDELYHYFGRGVPTACGINGTCGAQLVCEGDGSVFPCDFYVLDTYRMGSLVQSRPLALIDQSLGFRAAGHDYAQAFPCSACRYRSACGGGCKRMRDAMYLDGACCYYAKLLDDILQPLLHASGAFLSRHVPRSPGV